MTPERIQNLRNYIVEARRKGARDHTHAYMAPITMAELESLLEASCKVQHDAAYQQALDQKGED